MKQVTLSKNTHKIQTNCTVKLDYMTLRVITFPKDDLRDKTVFTSSQHFKAMTIHPILLLFIAIIFASVNFLHLISSCKIRVVK